MTKVKIIKSKKQLDKVIGYCKQTGYCSFDYETSNLNFHDPEQYPTVLGITFQPGSSWVLPLGNFDSPFQDNYEELLIHFGREVLEDPNIVKISWNYQYELKWSKRFGIIPKGIILDGMLAKYLLDEEKPHGLEKIVEELLPQFAGYGTEDPAMKGKNGEKFDWSAVPLKPLCKYCGIDTDMTFRLTIFFEQKLIQNKFYKLYRNLLMMDSRTLGESEYNGLLVDREYLTNLTHTYGEKIASKLRNLRGKKKLKRYEVYRKRDRIIKETQSIQEEITKLEQEGGKERMIINREEKISRYIAGEFTTNKEREWLEPINFNSPNQLIEFFFTHPKGLNLEVVKYTTDKKTKKPTHRPSTDEEVLLELKKHDKSGVMQTLLDYRGLTKLHSTYMVSILEKLSHKDRIHTSFLIHGTVTGRLSSKNPNLQNIPRGSTSSDIKKMFVPPKGMLLLEVDYAQAELRIVAELSGDETMIGMFKKGYSIHAAVAAKAYTNMTYEEFHPITKNKKHPKFEWANKLKKKAKTYNFGILYGQGPPALAETIAEATGEPLDIEGAKKGLQEWFDTFPGVKKWIDKQHRRAKRNGYVFNLFGRKRRLPGVYSENFGIHSEALRQSVNAPIQGASSDMTQFSSIVIREERMKGNFPEYLEQVYTVHDSIGYYIYPKDIHDIVPRLVVICADPQTKEFFGFQMKDVTMKVSAEIGITWQGLEDYDPKFDYSTLI